MVGEVWYVAVAGDTEAENSGGGGKHRGSGDMVGGGTKFGHVRNIVKTPTVNRV